MILPGNQLASYKIFLGRERKLFWVANPLPTLPHVTYEVVALVLLGLYYGCDYILKVFKLYILLYLDILTCFTCNVSLIVEKAYLINFVFNLFLLFY